MKKDKKPDTLVVINFYYFYDRRTYKHGDSTTNPAQKSKSVTSAQRTGTNTRTKILIRKKKYNSTGPRSGKNMRTKTPDGRNINPARL